jgi:co-chaperonin GroES (HSP10)
METGLAAVTKEQYSFDAIVNGVNGQPGIGDISRVEWAQNWVLVGIHVQASKTAGGIILTDAARMEDVYQGKLGYVLKMGGDAFAENDSVRFTIHPTVGDAVLYRASDGFPVDINGIHCRVIEDVHVKAIVGDPSSVKFW